MPTCTKKMHMSDLLTPPLYSTTLAPIGVAHWWFMRPCVLRIGVNLNAYVSIFDASFLLQNCLVLKHGYFGILLKKMAIVVNKIDNVGYCEKILQLIFSNQ